MYKKYMNQNNRPKFGGDDSGQSKFEKLIQQYQKVWRDTLQMLSPLIPTILKKPVIKEPDLTDATDKSVQDPNQVTVSEDFVGIDGRISGFEMLEQIELEPLGSIEETQRIESINKELNSNGRNDKLPAVRLDPNRDRFLYQIQSIDLDQYGLPNFDTQIQIGDRERVIIDLPQIIDNQAVEFDGQITIQIYKNENGFLVADKVYDQSPTRHTDTHEVYGGSLDGARITKIDSFDSTFSDKKRLMPGSGEIELLSTNLMVPIPNQPLGYVSNIQIIIYCQADTDNKFNLFVNAGSSTKLVQPLKIYRHTEK
ncbi:MAG: hypothetical protein OHK0017_08690 [Patescibacteria group bacterium]